MIFIPSHGAKNVTVTRDQPVPGSFRNEGAWRVAEIRPYVRGCVPQRNVRTTRFEENTPFLKTFIMFQKHQLLYIRGTEHSLGIFVRIIN